MGYRLALITDEPGWHGARLQEAFAARGHVSRVLSLQDCSLDLTPGRSGVRLPDFEDGLPDGVFVRGVPGGTLEEVIFHLDILHALQALGVPVYNDGRAIERSVDKGLTSFLLHRARIPTPPTRVFRRPLQAWAWMLSEHAAGHDVVSKPLFGSQGEGLRRLGRGDDLPDPDSLNGVFYLQRFIETGIDAGIEAGIEAGIDAGIKQHQGTTAPAQTGPRGWHDWRVFVIAGRAVAAMRREATSSWIANVARGALCQPALVGGPLRELAEAAARTLDMAYAGVDILRDRAGAYWVIEVNGIPAWKGLQQACGVDMAQLLAEDFLARVSRSVALREGARG